MWRAPALSQLHADWADIRLPLVLPSLLRIYFLWVFSNRFLPKDYRMVPTTTFPPIDYSMAPTISIFRIYVLRVFSNKRTRKLQYDCPPTPKPREDGKPAYIIQGPCSNVVGAYFSSQDAACLRSGSTCRGALQVAGLREGLEVLWVQSRSYGPVSRTAHKLVNNTIVSFLQNRGPYLRPMFFVKAWTYTGILSTCS